MTLVNCRVRSFRDEATSSANENRRHSLSQDSKQDVLEDLSMKALNRLLLQLGELAKYSDKVFSDLALEVQKTGTNVKLLGDKVTLLEERSKKGNVGPRDTNQHYKLVDMNAKLAVSEAYLACEEPPALNKLDPYTNRGRCMDTFSNPDYFFHAWSKLEDKENQNAQRQEFVERKRHAFKHPAVVEDSTVVVDVRESLDVPESKEDVHSKQVSTNPRTDPKYAKFVNMLKVGLDEDVVTNAMIREGLDPAPLMSLDFSGSNEDERVTEYQVDTSNESNECANMVEEQVDTSIESGIGSKSQDKHPKCAKFAQMLKVGLDNDVVKHAMIREGVDPCILFGEAQEETSTSHDVIDTREKNAQKRETDPKYAKFERMLKVGLAQDVVKHAMLQAGLDPNELIEETTGAAPLEAPLENEIEPPLVTENPLLSEDSGKTPKHPLHNKFSRMLKVGLDEAVVKHAMIHEGVDPCVLFGGESQDLHHEDTRKACVPPENTTSQETNEKMLKVGLDKEVVRHATIQAGLDPKYLCPMKAPPEEPTPLAHELDSKELDDKYMKMLAIGIHEDAVRLALIRDGIDPKPFLSKFPGSGTKPQVAREEPLLEATEEKAALRNPLLGAIEREGKQRQGKAEQAISSQPSALCCNPLLATIESKPSLKKTEQAISPQPSALFRNPLLAAIESKPSLKKVSPGQHPLPNEAQPNTTHEGNPLLAAIQQRPKLRPVQQGKKVNSSGNSMDSILTSIRSKQVSLRKIPQESKEEKERIRDTMRLTGVAAILSQRLEKIRRNTETPSSREDIDNSEWDN